MFLQALQQAFDANSPVACLQAPSPYALLMTTTYRIHADELDPDFVERVKAAFPHKLIEIAVTEADETTDLLGDPARRERLLRAAADVEAGRNVVVPDQSLFQ